MQSARSKQNRWVKGRNARAAKQVVVQRILPLQPGISQPYGMLAAPDQMTYSIENSVIKSSTSSSSTSTSPSSSSTEYKSTLTEENLSRMNHLTEGASSSLQMPSIDSSSSISSTINANDNDASNHSEQPKCDSGIETCDIMDSGNSMPDYSTPDADQTEEMDSDEEENNRIRRRLNEDPGIQSLMEISLPSPIPMTHSVDDCK